MKHCSFNERAVIQDVSTSLNNLPLAASVSQLCPEPNPTLYPSPCSLRANLPASPEEIYLISVCAALVGEDQPFCPDLPELDLSELDVSDLDADSFLGGLKWYNDQSEIISTQYGNDTSNLFE
ncbi:hypothetical protein FQN60_006113, partial [Etheostoma spectabile]